MLRKILAAPVAWIYSIVVFIRHKLFDWKVYRSEEFDIPIVCVGNITVGGTGKTPHTEYLVRHFRGSYNVAVLSRGYKRRTKGFLLAATDTSYLKIGDEPKQMKLKFPEIPVAVCEKRAEGIRRLREIHPEVNLVILDDAFQHRYVEPWVNVLLMDYNNPPREDHFLPLGRLRDSVSQIKRGNIVIYTKCPDDMKPIDYRVAANNLGLFPYQSLFFTRFRQGALVPIFPEHRQDVPRPGANVFAVAGLANPDTFFGEMRRSYNLQATKPFPDHHMYRMSDLNKISQQLSQLPDDTVIVVTEKDAVKLTNRKKIPVSLQKIMFYSPIEVEFLEGGEVGFNRRIDQYVRTNHKHSILHPE